jgi:hypothetical protein
MSDEDRKKHSHANDDAEETGADVEAHKKEHRSASDEGDDKGSDDVEAHMKAERRH